MSHKVLTLDPIARRRKEYEALHPEQMEAMIEAFATLAMQGYALGDKMAAVLEQRAQIKRRNPK